jgi:hypothetical protein
MTASSEALSFITSANARAQNAHIYVMREGAASGDHYLKLNNAKNGPGAASGHKSHRSR